MAVVSFLFRCFYPSHLKGRSVPQKKVGDRRATGRTGAVFMHACLSCTQREITLRFHLLPFMFVMISSVCLLRDFFLEVVGFGFWAELLKPDSAGLWWSVWGYSRGRKLAQHQQIHYTIYCTYIGPLYDQIMVQYTQRLYSTGSFTVTNKINKKIHFFFSFFFRSSVAMTPSR